MSTIHNQMNLRCGDDWDFLGTLENPDGSIMNLTGAQALTWKLVSLDFSKTILTLVLGNGVTITDAVNGKVAYGPSNAQTATIVPATYYDLLRVVLQDGSAFTMIEGTINALPAPV